MNDARAQAITQRHNLLNIERELDAQIERMQKLKNTTRRHIEQIEYEHGLNDSAYHKMALGSMKTPIPIDTQPEKL